MEKFDYNRRIKADAAFLEGDYETAFWCYFEGAVDFGDARSAFNLAFMYHQGYHTPRNYVWARKYYHLASYHFGGEAKFNLALMNMRGQGGETDHGAAYELMKASAAEGCIHAQMYLGVAYTLGYIFDPIETECISLIPFPKVVKRDPTSVLLEGAGLDTTLEDLRFEVIDADQDEAMDMFRKASQHLDSTYAEKEIGQAQFEFGRGLIEGFGQRYDPRAGYKMMERAAMLHNNENALRFLSRNVATAGIYGIDTKKLTSLLGEGKDADVE